MAKGYFVGVEKKTRLRVGIGEDINQIFCGAVNKDGTKWLANSNDCTSDVLATIYEYARARGGKVIVNSGNRPAFMISVDDLLPPEVDGQTH